MSTVEQQSVDVSRNGGGDGRTFAVDNPATGETIAHLPDMDAEQVRGLVERGRAAQKAWGEASLDDRAAVMYRARKWMTDNRERIAKTVMDETGKTQEDAFLADVFTTADALGFWAKKGPSYLADERVRSHAVLVLGRKLILRYRPYGVVGVIGPWNYPIANCFGDAIPALVAGNAVILKPSEVTPLSSLLMLEGMRAAGLPDDVMQVATGTGETGAALVDGADMIMFTGSTRTGKKIMARAAETLTPVSLELGGKDPMIVLSDADLERAANAAAFYGMNNGGQVCISVERVYVEEPVYDEFVAKVTEKVRELRQGVPGDVGSVDIGAITFSTQYDLIEDHVEDALARGARALTGGRGSREGGRFFEPTVLVDVDHSMKAMREETFGPTLPIMRVHDAEEAIRYANDTPYGLAASIWTKDGTRGERLARRLEAGAVTVNDAQVNYLALELPMGGWKASGLGSRHGAGGIRKYTRQQALLVSRLYMKRELQWFPYSAKTTERLLKLFRFLWGRGKRD